MQKQSEYSKNNLQNNQHLMCKSGLNTLMPLLLLLLIIFMSTFITYIYYSLTL